MAKRLTIAERRQAALDLRRGAVATLGLLARLREMMREVLLIATRDGADGVIPSPTTGALGFAFAELHARLETGWLADVRARTDTTDLSKPEVYTLGDEVYSAEEAREFMRKLSVVVDEELGRTEAGDPPQTPARRKFTRACQDFRDSYEGAALMERVQTEIAALLQDIQALRDLSAGRAMAAMLGRAPQERRAN